MEDASGGRGDDLGGVLSGGGGGGGGGGVLPLLLFDCSAMLYLCYQRNKEAMNIFLKFSRATELKATNG